MSEDVAAEDVCEDAGVEIGGWVCWLEPPAGAMRIRSAVVDLIRSTTGVAYGLCDDLLAGAARPTADGAFLLAQRLTGPGATAALLPLAKCWLWLAASLGHSQAARLLAREIAEEAVRAESLLPAAELMLMVGDWLRRGEDDGQISTAGSSGGGFSHALVRARRKPVMHTPSLMSVMPPRTMDDSGGVRDRESRVVLSRIGDAGSPQGVEISKRFAGVIGKSLPYKGRLPDMRMVAGELGARWPWAINFARWVEGQFALVLSAGGVRPRLPNVVLVGPSGCGKTTILEWLAGQCDMPSVTVSVGGTADSGGLAAVPRGWQTTQPSLPVRAFADTDCCNPCIILDELEKGVGDMANRNGSVMGALLAMTDTASSGYHDPCILAPVDLSQVTWMASVNSLAPLSPALRDRFLPQVIPPPSPGHFDIILPGVIDSTARKLNVAPAFMPFISRTDRAWMKAVFEGSGCSIRQLQHAYGVVSGDRALQEARAMQLPN